MRVAVARIRRLTIGQLQYAGDNSFRYCPSVYDRWSLEAIARAQPPWWPLRRQRDPQVVAGRITGSLVHYDADDATDLPGQIG